MSTLDDDDDECVSETRTSIISVQWNRVHLRLTADRIVFKH